MFRREIDGVSHYFESAGLWGSGNTLTERALIETGENTLYTSWTGEGLAGPRRGEFLDKYPALWGTLSLGEFIDRYEWLGTECKVWLRSEQEIDACEAVCEHLGELCNEEAQEQCLDKCGLFTAEGMTCLEEASTCDEARDCN